MTALRCTVALVLACACTVSVCEAAVETNLNGNAVKVTDLLVNGVTYEAVFEVGSFDDVFGATEVPATIPTFAGDSSAASSAASQLTSQLNNSGVLLVADSLGNTSNWALVPHDYNSGGHGAYGALINSPAFSLSPDTWGAQYLGGPRWIEEVGEDNLSYAIFTESSVGAVPELASCVTWLGLIGTVALRSRRNRGRD